MKYKNLLKKVYVWVLLMILPLFVVKVYAQYAALTNDDLQIAENINNEVTEFAVPDSIVVIPIAPPKELINTDPLDWYKGVYYYQVTRYGMPAISFHYVVTEEGKLIENRYSSADRKIDIQGENLTNPIIVGYITNQGSLGFKQTAKDRIVSVLTDIVNKNGIELDKIYIKSLEYQSTQDRKLIISVRDIFVGWENDLQEIIQAIVPQYAPISRVYSVSVEKVGIPTGELNVNTPFQVELSIKNNGEFPIYADSESELVLSLLDSEKESSKYFLRDIWDSQTQIRLMKEGDKLFPNEEKIFNAQFNVPFEFGQVSESFVISNLKGDTLVSTPVDIAISTKSPDGEVVEILDTETGYLRVRSQPGLNGEEIARVNPGQRFLVEEKSYGWVKIKLDDSRSGWVSGQYTKSV